jgi:ATP-dependent 26S proteasome regulatory subunit
MTIANHAALWHALTRLDRLLDRQVARLRQRQQLVESPQRGLIIPDAHVDALLRQNGRAQHAVDADPLLNLDATMAETESPLGELAVLYGLDSVATDLLLIALAPALDLRYETLFAYVQNDVTKKLPTVDLALKLLFQQPSERLAAQHYLRPDAPLCRERLLLRRADAALRSPLADYLLCEPRIVAHLLGEQSLDEALRGFCRLVSAESAIDQLAYSQALTEQLLDAVDQCEATATALVLHCPAAGDLEPVATALCAAMGRQLLIANLDLTNLIDGALPDIAVRLRRELRLHDAALFVTGYDALAADARQHQQFWLALGQPTQPIIIGTTRAESFAHWPPQPFIAIKLPAANYQRRTLLWEQGLAGKHSAEIDLVADRYRLDAAQITAAAQYACTQAAARGVAVTTADLQAAARARSDHGLAGLAQEIWPKHSFDDIILPPHSRRQLRNVLNAMHQQRTVYDAWQFGQKLADGHGIHVLFWGPSGTGKTMAASILARELGQALYKIDLATVVSKYIGETEKNLSRIFAAAENSNAILFFDEADALFGKRSAVNDARDRYANIEVAYLLQRMEAYSGMTILATNLRNNLDEAFARRLQYVIEFPQPPAALREQIWRHIFPTAVPLADDVDYQFLAQQFELAGGNIRNVALSAAFEAAASKRPIDMPILVEAIANELQKLGKLPTQAAFRDYFALLPQ